jgi:hypothetical protein
MVFLGEIIHSPRITGGSSLCLTLNEIDDMGNKDDKNPDFNDHDLPVRPADGSPGSRPEQMVYAG